MQCCCVVAVGDRSVEPTQHPCLCLLPEHFSGRLCWGVATNNSQVGPNPLVLIWPMALLSGSYRVAVVQSMWVGFVKIVSHEKKVKPATGLLANSRLQGQGPQEMRLLGLEFFTLCSHPIRTRGTRACEVAWVSLLPSPCFPAPPLFCDLSSARTDTKGHNVNFQLQNTALGFVAHPRRGHAS